jgi:hypothetical protein
MQNYIFDASLPHIILARRELEGFFYHFKQGFEMILCMDCLRSKSDICMCISRIPSQHL